MDRAQKEAFVEGFRATLQEAGVVVVAHYRGLTVEELTSLRREMYKSGAAVEVVKNRLAKIAMKDTPYINIEDLMTGPTAVATSADPIAAAKIAYQFAKDKDKFVILGGALGDKKLSAEEVKALANMPSLDQLRATLIGLISAPATRIATYTQEPAAMLARVLAAKGQQAA
ncbi:MAG: 50S ribosomal protein L10 [Proteobacteria bacterium]|nr:50S ribosomal protein L10 [Pseudomonadota bacterium]